MRNILFRAKDEMSNKWMFGYPVLDEKDCCDLFTYSGGMFHRHTISRKTIGQFTGLCDKNGNKIFEGDIVIDKYKCEKFGFVGVIEYVDQRSSFEIKSPKYPDYIANLGSRINSIKVIGNIYDNPELLKEV